MSDPRSVLEQARTVAVVGCSREPWKAAHRIPKVLQEAGFRVLPVNPHTDEVLGVPSVPTLADLDEPVDLVDVFRPSPEAADIARQAVAIGAKALWLQQGIRSAEARQIATEAGLDYVEDRCTGADVRWFGITKDLA